MRNLLRAGAMALACLCAPALAQVATLPQVKNAGGNSVPSQGSVIIGSDGAEKGTPGNPIYVAGVGGGGGGGDASAANQLAPLAVPGSDASKATAVQGVTGGKPIGTTIGGTLPAFATTPTFNIGTAPNLTITNSSFGISGTLPAFAAVPTFNIGTIGTAASAANQATGNTNTAAIAAANGAPADARCTTTDTTACTLVGLGKQLNYLIGLLNGYAADNATPSLVGCPVVSADTTYTVGNNAACTITAGGRLRVASSAHGNITPAAQAATNTTADLTACRYLATPPTWQDTWTGAGRCNVTGEFVVADANTRTLLATLSGQLPSSQGSKSNATSLAMVTPKSTTNGRSTLAGTTTSSTALAANALRNGCNITNESTSVAYIGLGTAAVSATSYDYMMSGSVNGISASFACPSDWVGQVNMIWVTATGTARISERTN